MSILKEINQAKKVFLRKHDDYPTELHISNSTLKQLRMECLALGLKRIAAGNTPTINGLVVVQDVSMEVGFKLRKPSGLRED